MVKKIPPWAFWRDAGINLCSGLYSNLMTFTPFGQIANILARRIRLSRRATPFLNGGKNRANFAGTDSPGRLCPAILGAMVAAPRPPDYCYLRWWLYSDSRCRCLSVYYAAQNPSHPQGIVKPMTERKPLPYLRKTITQSLLDNLETVTTIHEAAEQIGYSHHHVLLWATEGRIAARKSGNIWLISCESLQTYLQATLDSRRPRA